MTTVLSPTATRKLVDRVMGDENTKSSASKRIPRLCGRSHQGPIYCRPNVGSLASEASWEGVQAKNHSRKGQTMRSGRIRQNRRFEATTFANSANEDSKKHTAGAG